MDNGPIGASRSRPLCAKSVQLFPRIKNQVFATFFFGPVCSTPLLARGGWEKPQLFPCITILLPADVDLRRNHHKLYYKITVFT